MTDSKHYGIVGVGPDLELGIDGPRIKNNAGVVEVYANDGVTLTKLKGADGVGLTDFVTLSQLNTKANINSSVTFSSAILGDPGTESSGIDVNGTTFESTFKVSDIDGTNFAQTILHRHSTVLEPLIVGARSNSNTSSHANVTNGQNVFTVYGTGWAGTNYKIFGNVSIGVDGTGTVSDTSAPGRFTVSLTPDGSLVPSPVLNINNAGVLQTIGNIVAPSFNTVVLTGLSTPTLTVTGTTSVSGTNTGDQTITLTGNVTGSGTGSFATTIANNAVTNGMLATVATATFKGRTTAGVGNVEDLTSTQATALLNIMVGDSGAGGTKGLVPAPTAGDATKFLTGAGTYVAGNAGTVTAVSIVSANGFAGSSSGGATPAITLTTSVTGLVKGNGTALSAATSGTDYSAGTSALATGVLKSTTGTGVLSIAALADLPIQLYKENPSTPTALVTTGANATAIGSGASATSVGGHGEGNGSDAKIWGQRARANGRFATNGDAQQGTYVLRNITTNNTATPLYLDGVAATQRLVVSNSSVWTFSILVTARRTDAGTEGAGYKFEGVVRKEGTAASIVFVGVPVKTVLGENTAAWDAALTANTTDGDLRITVTGQNAKTIRWVAVVTTAEVTN